MSRRTDRVGGLLRQEISRLMAEQLKDPRLAALVSVTWVDVSPDLHYASVGISVLGTAEQQQDALHGMESAAGFLHRELKGRLRIRHIPTLRFSLDTSIEEGTRMLDLMDRVRAAEANDHA